MNDELIVLPTTPTKGEVNATTMILFGKEKCGKTTALTKLKDCLIVDTEKGTRLIDSLSIRVPEDRGPVGKMQWLKKLAEKLTTEKKYDYIAIDTLSEVNDWAEWSGTYRYMNSVQGKSFNRVRDEYGVPIKNGDFLDPSDDDYMSVHSLPDGNGYKWSRDEVFRVFDMFKGAAKKCVIFVCHIEDKYLALTDAKEIVVPKQLALTGKLRDALPRKVDAIGYIYHEKGETKVNFTSSENKTGGTRAKHLIGYNDVLDWNKIFIEE